MSAATSGSRCGTDGWNLGKAVQCRSVERLSCWWECFWYLTGSYFLMRASCGSGVLATVPFPIPLALVRGECFEVCGFSETASPVPVNLQLLAAPNFAAQPPFLCLGFHFGMTNENRDQQLLASRVRWHGFCH